MNMSRQLLSFSLVTSLLTLTGCGDPGLCTRGEPGCACTEVLDRCDDGSTCDAKGMCPAADGAIPSDEICTPQAEIEAEFSGVCTNLDVPPLSPFPADAEEACVYFCELFCIRKEQWCPTDRCTPGFCDPGQAQNGIDACLDASGGDVVAARDLCVAQDLVECPDVDCGGEEPACPAQTVCLNTCGFRNDGACDDGGDGALFGECDWGTDCTDCKPRYGAPPACAEISDCCRFSGDCCGADQLEAHCLGNGDGLGHCRRACSASDPCPSGFECLAITSGGQTTGDSACIPE